MNELKADFAKYEDGLMPAIIQDFASGQVLMLGYMNQQALEQTVTTKKVVFYSRSKKRLWEKGESSGNTLELVCLSLDCDNDAILIQAKANGPTCHTGRISCFSNSNEKLDGASLVNIFAKLSGLVDDRIANPKPDSYISKLLSEPVLRMAQKVGEEGVETALAAAVDNKEELKSEAADLIFHLILLLKAKGLNLEQVLEILVDRNK